MNGAIAASVVLVGSAASGGCIALAAHAAAAPRLHASWVRSRLLPAAARTRSRRADRVDLADLLDAVARQVRTGTSVPAALVASVNGSAHLAPWLDDVVRRCRSGDAVHGRHPVSTPHDRDGRIAHRALRLRGSDRVVHQVGHGAEYTKTIDHSEVGGRAHGAAVREVAQRRGRIGALPVRPVGCVSRVPHQATQAVRAAGMDATHDDHPFDLPPARELADTLMARAWDDDTPDRERLLLEQAALTITRLAGRCVDLAAVIEREELRRSAP